MKRLDGDQIVVLSVIASMFTLFMSMVVFSVVRDVMHRSCQSECIRAHLDTCEAVCK